MNKSLLKSTSLVSSMTMLSRVMGLLRDMVIAYAFGAAAGVDAFWVAFKIPNFMRRLFAEGAFSQAFVPVLSEYKEQKPIADVQYFVQKITGTLALLIAAMAIIAILAAPLLIHIFAPGFDAQGNRHELATTMVRITFPYLLLISLTALAGATQNSYGVFGPPAFTPVLLNLSLIVMALYSHRWFSEPITALAWGVLLAGIIQYFFQWPFLAKLKLLQSPKIGFSDPGVRRVMKLMLPALFGVSVAQINLMLDTIFASFLAIGSVSWLYYSDRLTGFPLGVFGVALATVVLPHLSKKHAQKAPKEFTAAMDWALRWILLIGVPSAVGLLLLAGPLLATLFNYGKFTSHDVLMTRQSLMAFALGVPAFMAIKVLVTGFYARQNIKTPVRIAAIAMITNMILNLILIFPLAHGGLALASSLSSSLNAYLLLRSLRKEGVYQPQTGWSVLSRQMIIANVVMTLFLIVATPNMSQWLQSHAGWRLGHLMLLIIVSMALYAGSLWLSGLRWNHLRVRVTSVE